MISYESPLDLILSPEAEAAVQLILDTWEPAPNKRILLILPCSARKPYRTSPSQQHYLRAACTVPGVKDAIEVVTLSGVFGIVPRQFEDLPIVLRYNLSLNRSKHTKGQHREIIEVLSVRVSDFLTRNGVHYSCILFYGRERYVRVMNKAISQISLTNVRVIGSRGIRLKNEGLKELKDSLINALKSSC